ncbi:MAG: tetratricopeptide repeat protein [Cytophagales bacterium]|uniref:tetratricopeptide repeat protein n=1 Tax=Cyclobacterium marinum TaxID=104 RepID=UPI0030DB706E|nr:tetratricopeptide repeat protein [Cytophagales bacterium]|tara:strand:+ start:57589 stop:59334 length:1746 start_codon:yes stop_codon:yes gene_type:complete
MNKLNLNFLVWFFTFTIFLGVPIGEAYAQKKLSRKERKAKEKEMMASRLFIEGQKNLMLDDYEKAYFYFLKALEFKEEESAIHFKLSQMMVRAKQYEKALSYGQRALELDPDNKYYHLQIAEIYNSQNKTKEAAGVLENLMAKEGNYRQYILDLASLYLKLQDLDKALEALNKAEEYYGVVEQLTAQKQRIYLKKNNLEMAIKEGEKLIEAHPGNSRYVLSLVDILFNNNKKNQALELVLSTLSSYPNQPDIKMAAYNLYKDRNENQLANKYLKEAFANPDLEGIVKAKAFSDILTQMQNTSRDQLLDSLSKPLETYHLNNPETLIALGDYRLQQKDAKKAINYYSKAVNITPEKEQLYQQLIPLMFENQEPFEEIAEIASKATENFPESAVFWFYLGTAKSASKENEMAKSALEKSIELNNTSNPQLAMMANSQLGDVLYSLGEKEKAFSIYEEVLSQNANNEHILNNYAYFLSLEKKNLEKALNMSQKLVKKYPDNPTYLDTHAWVLFQLDRYEEARPFMEKALEKESEPSGVMFEHYGDIMYKIGEKKIALDYWKKAMSMEDTSEFLALKIKNKTYYE